MAQKRTFWRWLAGFWEDGSDRASRKAAAGYWGLCAMTYMIVKQANGAEISYDLFFLVISFTAGIYGMILAERFTKTPPSSNPES